MNRLKNASFLDGVTNWNRIGFTTVPTMTVDETTRGAPGRAVLKVNGPVASGAFGAVYNEKVAVAPGDTVEAFSHFYAGATAAIQSLTVRISWRLGETESSTTYIVPRQLQTDPSRGIPATFGFYRDRVIAPANCDGALVILVAQVAPPGGQLEIGLLKPYLGVVKPGSPPPCWNPGEHVNPDLNLASWPEALPDFRDIESPRTPTRRAFETDSAIPASVRIGTRGRILFEGDLACDLVQRDILEQFVEARAVLPESRAFWFTHPDTRQLCRAWFNPDDGDPSDSGRGRDRRTRVKLVLEIA